MLQVYMQKYWYTVYNTAKYIQTLTPPLAITINARTLKIESNYFIYIPNKLIYLPCQDLVHL